MNSKISIILFLITASFLYSQSDVKILSSDFNSIVIEYTPQYLDTSISIVEGNSYRKSEIYLGTVLNSEDFGLPVKVGRKFNIGVPSEFGNTVEVLSTLYREISGQLLPVASPVFDTLSVAYRYQKNPEYYNFKSEDDLVLFGDYGLIRDVPVQTVSVNPIKFDALNNLIRYYSKIVFKINFAPASNISKNPADDLLDGVLINFDVARFWNNQSVNKINKITALNSVLATGKWVRFEAPVEGIYRINKSDLALYGINANTVDPRTIKIYNNGGKVLPENNSQPRPIDLEENAIIIVGQEDGKFDDADYILFYGRGSSFWDYENGSNIKRFFHTYSSKNYYWITSGGSNGKRMSSKAGLNTAPAFIQTTTTAYKDWEVDKINLGKSGRQFFGDDFSNSITSRTYTNTLEGRVAGSTINYNIRFVVGAPTAMTIRVSENGNPIFQQNLAGYSGSYVVGRDHNLLTTYNGLLLDNRSVVKLDLTPSSVSSIGYLDFLTIQYDKSLTAVSDNLLFFSNPNNGIIEYQLNGFNSSNINVFDVTNYSDVKQVSNFSMISGGECRFQFEESSTQRSKYFAIGNSGFKSPSNPVEIQNSNLRGEQLGSKFIIITHKNFREAANTLKSYKESQAPITISTYIADIEQIYNEFSCGIQDPSALRDYLKYAFENWQTKPQYVLLFGKGTYDYKNTEGYNDNFVPTWQSGESLNLLSSYTTDDFFVRVSGVDEIVDLAFGRITCANLNEANVFVRKIIDYETNHEKGIWRNQVTLIADDGLKSDGTYEGAEHTAPCENLSNSYFPKSFNFNKIYSAAYSDVITGQGRRKPEVNQAIINGINSGTLFLNYIGHGSPELWAHEVIFEKSVVLPQLQNDKYFFLCAATCDFGYYDIPNYQSAAEAIMMLPDAGSIAAFSAARLVYSSPNHFLNYDLVTRLFTSIRDTLNLSIPIGKAVFFTKQDFRSVNDQKYHLFGDPTLRLLVPQYSASIDSINGQVPLANIQIKALSNTKIVGQVLKTDNTPWTDFNGEGTLTVYDSERRELLSQIGNYPVNIPGGVIFNGRVSINNGRFSESFIVPKDISYENRNGKLIFYFLNNSADGLGYSNRIVVGGTDSSLVNDGKGPDIELFFDNLSNSNGYLVNQNPKLIVKLNDETGLNTTGTGVGHKLEGILNNQLTSPIDFTNYFTGDLDAGGKSGSIDYRFTSLEQGDYELLVKAWDVFNNFSEESTSFTVVNGNDIVIRDIYNYPNPFSDRTQFTFQHNLDEPINVKIKVYSIAGRLLKEIEESNIFQRFVVINWDGTDQDNDQLANGTYLYKVIVTSVDGDFTKSVLGKLAIIK